MTNEQDIADLKAEVAKRKDWRHRFSETLPLALFSAFVVASIFMQMGFSGWLGVVEERTVQIDARLARVETRLDRVGERLDQMGERLARVEERLTRIDDALARIEQAVAGGGKP